MRSAKWAAWLKKSIANFPRLPKGGLPMIAVSLGADGKSVTVKKSWRFTSSHFGIRSMPNRLCGGKSW